MAVNSFNLYITYIETKGSLIKLWGQIDRQTVEYIDSKLLMLNDQFNKGGEDTQPPCLTVGQMCYAQYNGIFYRAKVTNNTNISSGVVVVRFIDYGNSKVTSINNVRSIDADLAVIPAQAKEFYLHGVAPLSGTDLEEVTIDYMLQHMRYRDFQAIPVSQVNDKVTIKIFQNGANLGELMVLQKFAVSLDPQLQEEILRNMNNQLSPTVQHWQHQSYIPPPQIIPKAANMPNSMYEMHANTQNSGRLSAVNYGGAHPHAVGETTVKTFTSPILEPSSEHNVFVSNVEDGPLSFAVQLQAAEQTLIAVTADIASHRPIPLREPPVPGSVCLARFPGDTKLSRATIMEVMDTTCRLYYVDFGNVSDVQYTDIFELPAKLINPKAMALRFCLAGLKNGPPPSPVVKEAFRDIVKGCLLLLRVAPSPEGPPLKQYGYLSRDGRDVRLLYEELAKERMSRMGVQSSIDCSVPPVFYDPANSESVKDGTWVTISHIVSPDEFWVQLETDQSSLEQMMSLLDECCRQSRKIPAISDLRLKSPIFAQFSEDDRWYRATIVKVDKVKNGADVHVEFVDYGNEEAIEDFGRLRLAEPAIVRALPAQAIRCRLNGAANIRYKVETELWDQIAVKFADLTLETRGMVKLGPRGVGDPVVVLEELRDDTLTPPVVITMDAIYKAVIGATDDVNKKINLTIITPNDTGAWQNEQISNQDHNANTDIRSVSQSWNENWEEKKSYEDQGKKIGGRNSSQEHGYRDGRNRFQHGDGKTFGGGRGNQQKDNSDTESKVSDWLSGGSAKSVDSNGETERVGYQGYRSNRGGRGKSSDGGDWRNRDNYQRGGGDGENFGRGGRGGRGGYRGGRGGDDWENKDSEGGSGRGGYRGGRGGRYGGDRDGGSSFDDDKGFGGGGSRGGFRGRREGGSWGNNSYGQRDGEDGYGGGFSSSRGGRRGENDWDNRGFGGGGRGRRGGYDGDSERRGNRYGGDDDSSGGYQGRRGGRDGGDRPFREKKSGWNDREGGGGFQGNRGHQSRRDDWINDSGSNKGGYEGGLRSDMTNLNINEVQESTEDWDTTTEIPAEIPTMAPVEKLSTFPVNLGDLEQVTIVFGINRSDFYCHLNKNAEKLKEITDCLAEKYGSIEPTPATEVAAVVAPSGSKNLNLRDLKVGMPCAALYSEDSVWYRARVLGEPTAENVEVFFVDYGNGGEVGEGGVKELKPELRKLPAQAIRCSLLGLEEGEEDSADVDVEFELKVTSGEIPLEAVFVKKKTADGNDTVEVVLRNKDNGDCINLLFGGKDADGVKFEDSCPSSSAAEDDIPMPEIPIGRTADVDVVFVSSRSEFYCQLKESSDKLTEVMSALEEMCSKDETEDKTSEASNKAPVLKLADLKVGMPCAALYSEDEVWYRARVVAEPEAEGVEVCFIDYGNGGKVAEGGLRRLKTELCTLPAQAIRCCLVGLQEGEENQALDEKFMTEVETGEFSLEATCVRRKVLNGSDYVEVILKNKDTGDILNAHFGGSDEEVLDEVQEISPADAALKYGDSNDIPVAEFPIGTRCEVEIVFVVSRNEFYCQMKNTSEQLLEVMSSLGSLCADQEKEEEVPMPCENTLRMLGLRPGMPCAALYSEDNLWYRAIVLDEPKVKECGSGFVVKVKFVDYGNDAQVEDIGIRDLIPELLTEPAHAIPCCLLGFGENFVPDEKLDQEFEENTCETTFALFVQKVADSNRYEVLLKDPFSEEYVNEHFGAVGEVIGGGGFGLRPAMPRGCKLDVMVLWFVSPYRFYVQPIDWAKGLQEYMEKLQKVPKNPIFPWPPAVGTPVLAKFTQDGGLYRALVEEICLNSLVRVQYIDYGNRESLASTNVWMADPLFKNLSPQAIPCALQGVAPLNATSWPLPGCPGGSLDKYFSIEICSCIFHGPVKNELEVDGGIEGESRLWVSLIRPDGTDVAEELVSLGLVASRPAELGTPPKSISSSKMVFDYAGSNHEVQLVNESESVGKMCFDGLPSEVLEDENAKFTGEGEKMSGLVASRPAELGTPPKSISSSKMVFDYAGSNHEEEQLVNVSESVGKICFDGFPSEVLEDENAEFTGEGEKMSEGLVASRPAELGTPPKSISSSKMVFDYAGSNHEEEQLVNVSESFGKMCFDGFSSEVLEDENAKFTGEGEKMSEERVPSGIVLDSAKFSDEDYGAIDNPDVGSILESEEPEDKESVASLNIPEDLQVEKDEDEVLSGGDMCPPVENLDMELSLEKLGEVQKIMILEEKDVAMEEKPGDSESLSKLPSVIESDIIPDSKVELRNVASDEGAVLDIEKNVVPSEIECLSVESLDMNLAVEKLGEIHKNLLEDTAGEGGDVIKDSKDSRGSEIEVNKSMEKDELNEDRNVFEMEESLEYITEDVIVDEIASCPPNLTTESSFNEIIQEKLCEDNADELVYDLSANSVPVSSLLEKDEQDELHFEDAEDDAPSALAKDILSSSVDGDKDAAARVQQVVERYYQEAPKPLAIDKIQIGRDYYTQSAADDSKMVAVKVLDLSGTVGAVVEFMDGFVDEVPLDKIYECPPEMAVLPSPDASPMSSLTIVGETIISDNVSHLKGAVERKLEEVRTNNDESAGKDIKNEDTSVMDDK